MPTFVNPGDHETTIVSRVGNADGVTDTIVTATTDPKRPMFFVRRSDHSATSKRRVLDLSGVHSHVRALSGSTIAADVAYEDAKYYLAVLAEQERQRVEEPTVDDDEPVTTDDEDPQPVTVGVVTVHDVEGFAIVRATSATGDRDQQLVTRMDDLVPAVLMASGVTRSRLMSLVSKDGSLDDMVAARDAVTRVADLLGLTD